MSWNQGRQAPGPSLNPPPVCFNCNQPGHYVINCPSRNNAAPFPTPPMQQHQAQHPQYAPQGALQPNYQPPVQYQPPNQNHPPSFQQPYGQVHNAATYSVPQQNGPYGQQPFQPPAPNHYPPQHAAPPQPYVNPAYSNTNQTYGQPHPPPYQPPQANFNPQPNGYNPAHGQAPSYQPPPPQWNHGQQAPTHAPLPPQQQFQGAPYGNPGGGPPFPPQPQPLAQQAPYQGFKDQAKRSKLKQRFSRSSLGGFSGPRRPSQSYAVEVQCDTNLSSSVVSPNASTQSVVTTVETEIKSEAALEGKIDNSPETLEGTPEPVTEVEQFEWDAKKIFQELPDTKLAFQIAQPIDATLDKIPDAQQDSNVRNPGSRYATERNQKEFTLSVRDIHRWSSVQNDPVFVEFTQECPVVPIDQVLEWWARRQDLPMPEVKIDNSRKRNRTLDDNEVQDTAEALLDTPKEGTRDKKRHKTNVGSEADGSQTEDSVNNKSPIAALESSHLDRERTPCVDFGTDDAWAPEPGEIGAVSSPADPTAALLASLGVTGEARPPTPEPLPPYVPKKGLKDENARGNSRAASQVIVKQEPHASLTYEHKPVGSQGPAFDIIPNQARSNMSKPAAQSTLPQGSSFIHQQPPTQQNGPLRSASWSNNSQNFQLNGASGRGPFSNGQANSTPYYNGDSHQGPNYDQRSMSLSAPQAGAPYYPSPSSQNQSGYVNGFVAQGQSYGQPPYGNGQSQGQYSSQYQNPPHPNSLQQGFQQWGPGTYPQNTFSGSQYPQEPSVPQHYQHANGQYTNSHQFAGVPRQENYDRRGPPQNTSNSYNQVTNSPVAYAGPQQTGMFPNQQQSIANPQSVQAGGAHHQLQQAPSRQDSGYISARGSYSVGQTGDSDSLHAHPSQIGGKLSLDTTSRVQNQPSETQQSPEDMQRSASQSSDEELSPTSMAVLGLDTLGKFDPRTSKKKNQEKRTKRPQPIVDEAYGRRW